MPKKIILFLLCLCLLACEEEDETAEAVSKIPVEVEVTRFDQRFAGATADSLPVLKNEFPFLFPKQYHDSVWIGRLTDTVQLELNRAVATEFPELSQTTAALEQLFQHIKYYFPETELPEVVTLTSYVDYRNQVIWSDKYLLIALDTYLGEDHPLYTGVQEFIRTNLNKEQIVVDAAAAFAETVVPKPESRSFLADMIYYGKLLYLKDLLIPFRKDHQKIGYSPEELKWAAANEEQIWRYFIDNELLFSSDAKLGPRFIEPAPFSKFYLQLDREAPPRLGRYIGWQIVRQYMQRTETSLDKMLQVDAREIFNKSNYKPKK